jgi:hypothetical protein
MEFGAIGYGVFGRLSPESCLAHVRQSSLEEAGRLVGVSKLRIGSSGCGTAKHQPLYWHEEAAHSKFHCSFAYLSAVFGQSEETWVCTPPVLVGAAVGP